jgi:4-amino-4-deoxy-L-arabinose transferase-like glycosyltransferase
VSSTSFNSICFGFFLGLAVLAKGPAAIVLSGGAVLVWAVFTQRWSDAFRCLHPLAIASFGLTALPWYILCSRRNPDFFRVFIIEHNFKRFLTPEFQHIQPFWFYIPILFVAFLPWMLALLWSVLYGALRSLPTRRASPITALLLCWSIFCLAFFSLSKSKLPGYILPAIPAIGLLLARSYVHWVVRNHKSFRWLHFAIGFTVCGLSGFWLIWSGPTFQPSRTSRQVLTSIAWTLFLFALANLLLALRHKETGNLRSINSFCVVPILVLVCLFQQISSPWLRYDPSGKTLARELAEKHIPFDKLYTSRMSRGQQYSLSFYMHHEIESWDKEHSKDGYLLTPSKWCGEFVASPWVCAANPIELPSSGWFVYQVERSDSAGGLNGLGTLGRNHDLGERPNRDRQMR